MFLAQYFLERVKILFCLCMKNEMHGIFFLIFDMGNFFIVSQLHKDVVVLQRLVYKTQ